MRPPFKPNNQAFATANAIGKQNQFQSSSESMCTNLWVGNLAADVTDSDLRNLFEKHGAVDTVTCYPARSYAFVNMKRPDDAKRAKESLQGSVLRGGSLKIDFAKPARPCKSLWVSGISISATKEDLEQEFSKFGKIEDFRFIRDKNTAFIDYARLEDASKALKMMHGKHRAGSMLRVDYLRSNSKREQGPDFHEIRKMGPLESPWLPPDAVKNFSDPSYFGPRRQQHISPLEGQKGNMDEPSNVLVVSYPPTVHVDEQMLHNSMILFGEIDNITSFPSRNYSLVEFRSIEEAQFAKEGLQGRLFNDPRVVITSFHPVNPNSLHAGAPPYGVPFGPQDGFDPLLHGPPEFNMSGPNPVNPRPSPGAWDAFDREPKRLRMDQGILGPAPAAARLDTRLPTRGNDTGRPNSDYIWRGVIAKGGTHVCHARCVPIKDWIGYDIPEVVNCSARTGLDMLAKHYTDAVGFDIVFFLPDSEEDFASYTEFVHYLGDKNRAGVAKFDDGTTLFLVPPSEFLSNVLNVFGPERLYGVVLKFPQHTSASSSAGPLLAQSQNDELKSNPKSTGPQTGLNLTPELIATLASLAKGKLNGLQPSGGPVPDERPVRAWEYEPQPSNLSGHLMQQADNTFHGQSQTQILPQHQGYQQSNMVNDPQLVNTVSFPPVQDYSFNMPPVHPSQQYLPNLPQDHPHPSSVLPSGINFYGGNVYQPQNVPGGPEMQQVQSAVSQQVSEVDADKNERYQSTLQFATNLLLQIHQQQQQQPGGHGSLH